MLEIQGLRFGVQDFRFAVQDFGFGVQDFRFGNQDFRFRVQDLRFGLPGFRCVVQVCFTASLFAARKAFSSGTVIWKGSGEDGLVEADRLQENWELVFY